MARVSGTYKRYCQFWLYVWAAVLVLWLNVDTLEIARRLLADAQFRSTIAAGGVSFAAQIRATNTVAATTTLAGNPAIDGIPPSAQPTPGTISLTAAELLQQIGQLNLPLGWGACTNGPTTNSVIGWVITCLPRLELFAAGTNTVVYSGDTGVLAATAPCPASPQGWRLKLLGLLITIAAISQGAPFWFDLLNRVTNLRAAGRPPEPRNSAT
jgi:hypothetical protein